MKDWDNFHHTAYRKVRNSKCEEVKENIENGESQLKFQQICMKLGNSPKISLPAHQNGVKNRDRVYFKIKEEFCILTNAKCHRYLIK